MKKNIIRIVFKRFSILFVIILSLTITIDHKFFENNAPIIMVKVTVRNIIQDNKVIDVFLTKAINQSNYFQKQKLERIGDSNIYVTTLSARSLGISNKLISKLKNELLKIEKKVNLDLTYFIKTNEPKLMDFPDTLQDDMTIIIDKNDIVNDEQNEKENLVSNEQYKKAYEQRLDIIRREQGVDIGYFMVTNNENFLIVDIDRSSKNLLTLMNHIAKYAYLTFLSLVITLFILYLSNITRKSFIIKVLKNFT